MPKRRTLIERDRSLAKPYVATLRSWLQTSFKVSSRSFRNARRKGLVADQEAIPLWRAFTEVPILLVPPAELMESAIALSLAHDETASDSLFVALALREGLKVVTGDWRMHKAFISTGCVVHISQFSV